MEYVIKNGKFVYAVEQVTTEIQTYTVEKFYDMLLHTDVSYNPLIGKVSAKVYDYLNNLQSSYPDIIFEYEGQQIIAPYVDGEASITFSSTVPGDHVIRTLNANIRNGEVTIHV